MSTYSSKIDFNSIGAYSALPADRQEVIILQAMYHEGTNFLGPFLNAARESRDILYMVALIERHRREVAAGTPLLSLAGARVTPVANCQARFLEDTAADNRKHN